VAVLSPLHAENDAGSALEIPAEGDPPIGSDLVAVNEVAVADFGPAIADFEGV
jgi:hypothetical protein